MFIYIALFAFCILMFLLNAFVKDNKIKKIIVIITFIVLCLISGTRYKTGGTDYYAYENIYDNINVDSVKGDINSINNNYGVEYGFLVFAYIIKNLGFNYYGFILINSVIFYVLFYIAIKKYNYNINFIIITFLYKMFFYNTFVSLRQPLAILIFWLSFPYLQQKKYIKYYIMCGLAFLFHRSSVFLFIIPFIMNIKLSKKRFLVYLITGIISYICIRLNIFNINLIIQNILNFIFGSDSSALERIESYTVSTSGMSIFYLLEYYVIAICLYIHFDKVRDSDKNADFFIKLFICLLPFYTVLSSFSIVTRLKDYFFLAYPIIIVYIARCMKKKEIIVYFLAIFICCYGFFRYINAFDGGSLKNYESFLDKDVSIFIEK